MLDIVCALNYEDTRRSVYISSLMWSMMEDTSQVWLQIPTYSHTHGQWILWCCVSMSHKITAIHSTIQQFRIMGNMIKTRLSCGS